MTAAIHAPVTNIRIIQTRGVVQLVLEVPDEAFADVAQHFYRRDCLVTVRSDDLAEIPYGVLHSEDTHVD